MSPNLPYGLRTTDYGLRTTDYGLPSTSDEVGSIYDTCLVEPVEVVGGLDVANCSRL